MDPRARDEEDTACFARQDIGAEGSEIATHMVRHGAVTVFDYEIPMGLSADRERVRIRTHDALINSMAKLWRAIGVDGEP